MIDQVDLATIVAFLAVVLGTAGVALLMLFWIEADRRRAQWRLRELTSPAANQQSGWAIGRLFRSALVQLGACILPGQEPRRTRFLTRFVQAGIYSASAPRMYLGVRLLLTVLLPILAGVIPYWCELLAPHEAISAGAIALGVGMIGPSFWLETRKRRRQAQLRRALPDAVDMLVLCVESGISLLAALQRVTNELWAVHPELAAEFAVAQREIQMGLSAGEALKKFGERCDLEDVRELAGILLQSERFGAGAAQALRAHADSWRQERQQQLEEQAQKAGVKILFPTLLCIFPAVFIVTLGPAIHLIANLFADN